MKFVCDYHLEIANYMPLFEHIISLIFLKSLLDDILSKNQLSSILISKKRTQNHIHSFFSWKNDIKYYKEYVLAIYKQKTRAQFIFLVLVFIFIFLPYRVIIFSRPLQKYPRAIGFLVIYTIIFLPWNIYSDLNILQWSCFYFVFIIQSFYVGNFLYNILPKYKIFFPKKILIFLMINSDFEYFFCGNPWGFGRRLVTLTNTIQAGGFTWLVIQEFQYFLDLDKKALDCQRKEMDELRTKLKDKGYSDTMIDCEKLDYAAKIRHWRISDIYQDPNILFQTPVKDIEDLLFTDKDKVVFPEISVKRVLQYNDKQLINDIFAPAIKNKIYCVVNNDLRPIKIGFIEISAIKTFTYQPVTITFGECPECLKLKQDLLDAGLSQSAVYEYTKDIRTTGQCKKINLELKGIFEDLLKIKNFRIAETSLDPPSIEK